MPASKPAGVTKPLWFLVAGLLHAALMLLAFPPLGLWPACVLAPMPLIWAAQRWGSRPASGPVSPGRWRRVRWLWARSSGPLWVSLGCTPLHFYAHQWVFNVSEFGYPPMVVGMSLFSGAFVWALSRTTWRWPRLGIAFAPALWTMLEIFRGEIVVTGYPWVLIAHPMIDAPHFPGVAALLGTYFAGFLVVAAATAMVEGVMNRRFASAAAWLACVGAVVGIWGGRSRAPEAPPIRFGVVQTNVPQSNKSGWDFARRLADFKRFCELTREAAAQHPSVIVWPETMFPGLTLSEQGMMEERAAGLTFDDPTPTSPRHRSPSTVFFDGLMQLSVELNLPMLVGALGFDQLRIVDDAKGNITFDHKGRYNSVFLVSNGVVDPAPYNKLELTPFGEIMPYANHWPWLQNIILGIGANGMAFDLSSGRGPRAFSVAGVSVVTPICFEATKPHLCRRLVRDAGIGHPVVIVNPTNDGWFGSFRAGRLQHMQVARWRCVELGVPMVRAANTGISAVIDASGRLVKMGVEGKSGAWDQDGVLMADVTPGISSTVYARIGDVFGWVALATGLLAVIATFVFRKSNPST